MEIVIEMTKYYRLLFQMTSAFKNTLLYRENLTRFGAPELNTLWSPMMYAEPEMKFRCTFCQMLLSSKGSLRNHVVMLHTKNTAMHCYKCNKPFIRQKLLNVHEEKCRGPMH